MKWRTDFENMPKYKDVVVLLSNNNPSVIRLQYRDVGEDWLGWHPLPDEIPQPEIKPCPACGGVADICLKRSINNIEPFEIVCLSCGLRTGREIDSPQGKNRLITTWNSFSRPIKHIFEARRVVSIMLSYLGSQKPKGIIGPLEEVAQNYLDHTNHYNNDIKGQQNVISYYNSSADRVDFVVDRDNRVQKICYKNHKNY